MFEPVIAVAIILAVVSLWSVSQSLERIAKDLRIIAGRDDSKPQAEDPEELADA
ncbi:hypothetical protein [Tautonia plasticadhaerens]|uniref:Uncharacterized protein n=1 Tax=Tautonia plasticadhaerens TaxID=2527974 RepID=A0A518HCD7_9BACT|nr:hypothetical protein [Tautonia plasticadhaerens]QDV38316.1 hypothetical protein ElP_62680 [Tautonia plasticadhaerens]